MNLPFAKVKATSRFVDMIVPWNNCRPHTGKRDFDGPTEKCGLTRLRKPMHARSEIRLKSMEKALD
jgi:hypothetical protein